MPVRVYSVQEILTVMLFTEIGKNGTSCHTFLLQHIFHMWKTSIFTYTSESWIQKSIGYLTFLPILHTGNTITDR